jgi:hypothetical protein
MSKAVRFSSQIRFPGSGTVGLTAFCSVLLIAGCGTTRPGVPSSSSSSPSTPTTPSAGVLTADPASVAFGNLAVGGTATESITLTASSAGPVRISTASASGPGFSISGLTTPVNIAAGDSATLNIEFTPAAVGSAAGTLSVASNGGSLSIPLTGSGQQESGAYAVQMTWSAPETSADPAVGYELYRTTVGSNVYELLNASLLTETSFTDHAVANGQTYAYYVTGVDAKGNESSPSNVLWLTIP